MAASRKRRKAKQAAREKPGVRKQRKNYAKKITADAGPVSLAEAKALAQAKDPKLAVRAVRKGAVPPASPASVGAERERLEQDRRAEFTRRIQEYKATMDIMKKERRPKATVEKSRQAKRPRAGSRG